MSKSLAVVLLLTACGGHTVEQPVLSGRASPSKTLVVMASHRMHPANLAVDGDGAYWTEPSDGQTTILHLAATAAMQPPAIVAHTAGAISDLALDGDQIYFTVAPAEGPKEIRRVGKHGGREVVVVPDAGADHLAIDATHVFWGTGGGQIAKIAKAGKQAPVTLADSVEYSYMGALAIDASNVYFSNALDDTPNRIYRVAKTGGDVARVDGAAGVGGWSVAGNWIYYDAEDSIWKVAKAAAEPAPIKIGSGHLYDVDGDRMFYVEQNRLRERSVATGQAGALDLAITDDILETVFAAGAWWFVRDATRDGDAATGDILLFVP